MEGTARVTIMALLIIFGSATFCQILAFSGASSGLIVIFPGITIWLPSLDN